MGSLRWPKLAQRNLRKSSAKRTTAVKQPGRRVTLTLEKLEDRLALAPIVTPHYTIPNFGDYATIQSDSSGAWSNPDTWSAGRVPTAGDVVVIAPGTSVTYDLAASAALDSVVIYAGGVLSFRTDISTQMLVTNLQVLEGGELRVGTAANPVAPNVTAQIVFRNVAINLARDSSQFGNGLIGLGKVTMHGSAKVSAIRLAAEPRAGDATLVLEQAATGWRVGDKLFLPDSKQWAIETQPYSPSYEDATIAAISTDGKTITLTAPLQFTHPGARNGSGALEFLPHVANRTRNVILRSENSAGARGHVFFTHRADVDVRYVGVVGTGRTLLGAADDTTYDGQGAVTHIGANQSDRHPVNFAHLYGPVGGQASGYQFTFIGNAVFCGLPTHSVKWGIAIEDSHYGLIQGNYLHNWAGAGLITVSGNESHNVIENNFAFRGRGIGGRNNGGNEGVGFWFKGVNNRVRNNVAANFTNSTGEAAYGFKFLPDFATAGIHLPNFAGADTTLAGQYSLADGRAMPILEFSGNEMYGIENGLAIWEVNAADTTPNPSAQWSVVHNFRAWHFSRYAFYGYPMSRIIFDGYTAIGDKNVLANANESVLGMWFGDYLAHDIILRNSRIECCSTGFVDPYFGGGRTLIEDSYFNNVTNIAVVPLAAPGSGGAGINRQPKRLTIRDVTFGSTAGWPIGARPTTNIAMKWQDWGPAGNYVALDEVYVENYNGTGQNYRLYYSEQAANWVWPSSYQGYRGAAQLGLTNEQNWQQNGVAIAGAVAPGSATTLAGVVGLAVGYTVPPDTTPPTTPAGLTATAVSSSRIDLSWTASTDDVGVAGYRIFRNGVQIASTSGTSYSSWGLAAGTTYTFFVAAYDSAGNTSDASTPASATTLAPPPPPPSTIIDDGNVGSRFTLGWTRATGRGYAGDVHTAPKGSGGKNTSWTFTGLEAGHYNVWVTYTTSNKNATNAPYAIHNGDGSAPIVRVNQRQSPTHVADGAKWRFLRQVNVSDGWAMVRLTNQANGRVVADAVRLVKVPSAGSALAASPPTAARVASLVEFKPRLSVRSFVALASDAPSGGEVLGSTELVMPTPQPVPPTTQAAAHDAALLEDGEHTTVALADELAALLGEMDDRSSNQPVEELFAAGFTG